MALQKKKTQQLNMTDSVSTATSFAQFVQLCYSLQVSVTPLFKSATLASFTLEIEVPATASDAEIESGINTLSYLAKICEKIYVP